MAIRALVIINVYYCCFSVKDVCQFYGNQSSGYYKCLLLLIFSEGCLPVLWQSELWLLSMFIAVVFQ